MFFECQISFSQLIHHVKLKLSETAMDFDCHCTWMHSLKWRFPAPRSLQVRQLSIRELWVLRPRPEVMGCNLASAFEKWILGTQFCSYCREWSQPGLTVQVKIMVDPAIEHPKLEDSWYRFLGQVVPHWACHLLWDRPSIVVAPPPQC